MRRTEEQKRKDRRRQRLAIAGRVAVFLICCAIGYALKGTMWSAIKFGAFLWIVLFMIELVIFAFVVLLSKDYREYETSRERIKRREAIRLKEQMDEDLKHVKVNMDDFWKDDDQGTVGWVPPSDMTLF